MPEMNGVDAILAIRKDFPNARIIVLTTYGGDVQAVRAFDAGACGYLLKNMVRKELVVNGPEQTMMPIKPSVHVDQ